MATTYDPEYTPDIMEILEELEEMEHQKILEMIDLFADDFMS